MTAHRFNLRRRRTTWRERRAATTHVAMHMPAGDACWGIGFVRGTSKARARRAVPPSIARRIVLDRPPHGCVRGDRRQGGRNREDGWVSVGPAGSRRDAAPPAAGAFPARACACWGREDMHLTLVLPRQRPARGATRDAGGDGGRLQGGATAASCLWGAPSVAAAGRSPGRSLALA